MAIEKDFFRQVMGHFVTGVAIVTTKSQDKLASLTVNSFTSLSLNPPLVLICIESNSHTIPIFRESKIFAVNFLTTEQVHISRCFAIPSQERFEHFCHVSHHIAATGAPILDDALAFVDTHLVAEYPGGDHIIFVGQIAAMGTGDKVVFADEEAQSGITLFERHQNTNNGGNDNSARTEAAPLAYYRGQYRHLAKDYSEPSLAEMYGLDLYQSAWWWDPWQ